jgi:hypothetical protein
VQSDAIHTYIVYYDSFQELHDEIRHSSYAAVSAHASNCAYASEARIISSTFRLKATLAIIFHSCRIVNVNVDSEKL